MQKNASAAHKQKNKSAMSLTTTFPEATYVTDMWRMCSGKPPGFRFASSPPFNPEKGIRRDDGVHVSAVCGPKDRLGNASVNVTFSKSAPNDDPAAPLRLTGATKEMLFENRAMVRPGTEDSVAGTVVIGPQCKSTLYSN